MAKPLCQKSRQKLRFKSKKTREKLFLIGDPLSHENMRRRQHHSRSRNGCSTCKRRHVRCDERLPYCGNCLRVGRECIYAANTSGESSDSAPDTPPLAASSTMSSLTAASQQAWVARNLPQGHAVNFLPPHYRELDAEINSMLQQAHEILGQRPVPRTHLLPVQKESASRYNRLATQHKCVRFAHISLAAYTHHQETDNSRSRDIFMSYTGDALNELQQEIENFSGSNADAIVVASICLAGTADNWEQWLVFMDGYSRALSHIRNNNVETICPELLGDDFQLCSFFQTDDSAQTQVTQRVAAQERVRTFRYSVNPLEGVIGQAQWLSLGFSDLQKLADSVEKAYTLDSDSEIFHELAWLRTWMFWTEICSISEGYGQRAFAAYFYALLLTAVPLFPARYAESVASACIGRMGTIIETLNDELVSALGLKELLNSTRGL